MDEFQQELVLNFIAEHKLTYAQVQMALIREVRKHQEEQREAALKNEQQRQFPDNEVGTSKDT